MRVTLVLLLALGLVTACEKGTPSSGQPSSEPPSDPACGTRPKDWCPSPSGDPCGVHKDVDGCRADKRCKGMAYRGESLAACIDDGSGFSPNCPTVGCISR